MQQLDPKLELPRPPRPLIESNPVAQPYPVQALSGILGPAVERMTEVIGVPQTLAAQPVSAASALVTQGHVVTARTTAINCSICSSGLKPWAEVEVSEADRRGLS